MNHATVKPARIKLRSDTLDVDVLATIGHRATCDRCRWRGPMRDRYSLARDDRKAHECGPVVI